MTHIEQLYEALDNMDDYALMADIKPIGPHKVLTDGIKRLEAAEKLITQLESALDSCGYADDSTDSEMCGPYFDYEKVSKALAAAKAFKEGV